MCRLICVSTRCLEDKAAERHHAVAVEVLAVDQKVMMLSVQKDHQLCNSKALENKEEGQLVGMMLLLLQRQSVKVSKNWTMELVRKCLC